MRRMPNGDYPPIHPAPPDTDWRDEYCPGCGKLSPGAKATVDRMIDQAVAQTEYELLEHLQRTRWISL